MKDASVKIHHWLYPLSWLYGAGVCLRNKLFDWGWLRSRSFDVPVICVGNIAVGGTGKTPHTEYLIKLLQNEGINVATLSRGYKRKSKGYILATAESSVQKIGDEPYQIKSKFPDIRVAVDENRCHGIEQLLTLKSPAVDAVLLDDAFQHRHVKAGMNILLTDYHRLLCDDALLPAGRLREPACGKNRAQIVIVTKCPDDIKPIDFNIITKRLNLYPYQQLYFSRFRYGSLMPLFPEKAKGRLRTAVIYGSTVLATVLTKDFSYGMILGDGGFVVLGENDELFIPIEDKNSHANYTSSLCNTDAIHFFEHWYTTEKVKALFVSTDGLFKSFASEEDFLKYHGLLSHMFHDTEKMKKSLKRNFEKRTREGSGDDISIAFVYQEGETAQ